MELQIARQIIETLAQGIHPVTGEAMPDDSPYNAPPVIRALHAVARALAGGAGLPEPHALLPSESSVSTGASRTRRAAPPNAGKPWSAEDDAALVGGFEAGNDAKALAATLGRTRFGIEQRLVKLGKVAAPPGGGRYGAGAAAH